MTHDAVTFTGVTKDFGAVRAVDGLTLAIPRGQTVALLGPNGAGKSTSLSMLLGLLAPGTGAVRLFGADPERAVRAGRVGAMPQAGRLIPRVGVRELVNFVRGTYPSPPPLAGILETARITDLAGRRVDTLSGGQAQRVRFALALAGDPDLIVLDEPTAALDVESRRELWESIRVFAGRGRTVLFSTHYLEEADDHADRIVVMGRGRLVADGTPAEIKQRVCGRTVSVDTARPLAELAALPGVVAVEVRADRARLSTTDSDATVLALARTGAVRNLEVTGADLEEAFLILTAGGVR
jgi:ABC-2 type transport system ATP-binding protein